MHMDKSREQIAGSKHTLTQAQAQELDFRHHAPPVRPSPQGSSPKKHIHAYTLHARSDGRLKDAAAPVAIDPQKAS
jgi:hypothetical protein